MVFRMKFSGAPAALGLVALLLFLPGCPLSPDSDDGGTDPDLREPERTSVDGAIELYAFAWAQKRLDLYEQLLHDDFEFLPQDEDADIFEWIPEDGWGRTVELEIAGHMFDEQFSSEEQEDAVDTIEMTLTTTNSRSVEEGVEVTVSADIEVLWADNTGARSDVRFVFIVVEDPHEPGLFQIFRQEELPAFG
ncbi:MAG TPA: hypothetical protein VKU85_09085 [bacterium]|nr:hypothetical protein [bacterium]